MAAGQYRDEAVAAANRYGVPVEMFLWQIGKESSWDPNAKNPKSSATGIAQFTEATAKDFGINPLDPIASLDAAAKYDAQLFKKTGSWEGALTSYGTLHDADPGTLKEFRETLGGDGQGGGLMDSLGAGIKAMWENSIGGLAVDTYKNMTGQGTPSGKWDFSRMATTGTFIILGIVVIVLAILSNKTVQQAVTTVATKGK